ncbi:hypothetical protein TPHA_0C00400 [Tetrapisispora phaffii CBS 4417]|uniref:FAS1 domain-containing protein n=1 Tax=Tetrapisispora phaffii (strain ATCC 24235 / CBS 4417 / NBRC 1672 / NRRL Y-8282 / UCD 70-5) TaxID=1071381 RepID=G8BR21_TETPH|nr:hypothetical protein TPHA_0C00400 [Tetrapisispora phaffii CBS 4417]CCE62197.1 hypothetical protein TPHA_0C00400 [Tetrapisispora phaffii CBS 4417]
MYKMYEKPILTFAVFFLYLSLALGKEVVDLITYKDANGRLHKRFADENIRFTNDKQLQRYGPVWNRNMDENQNQRVAQAEKITPLDLNKVLSELFPFHEDKDFMNKYNNNLISDKYDTTPVQLNSTLASSKNINIFASYTRMDVALNNLLMDEDQDLIVISPINESMMRLSMKPWQFPKNIEAMEANKSSDQAIDKAIQDNIANFVRSHVVSYEDNKSTYGRYKNNAIVLRSLANQTSGSGDVLLQRESNGDYFVASVNDKVFTPVLKIVTSVNGVVLFVNDTLIKP